MQIQRGRSSNLDTETERKERQREVGVAILNTQT